MNLEQITDEKIILEVLWLSSDNVSKKITETRERTWRRVIDKNYRKIEYVNSEKKTCLGYSSDTSSVTQPFALYIRNLFGDGIYYTNEEGDKNYLLAIINGEVIQGTDVYINSALFERYRQKLLSEEYSSLQWHCLTMAHIDEVIEANNLYKRKKQKKKLTYLSVMLSVGVICLMLFTFALKIFLVN
ncbi:pilus assembly protein [Escherichia albertii]|uniref:pilus assembly protein n=1 Tax=Escherichia albertii TaxID=208962 RepID=UPI001374FA8A|nr:pilus assembly protein [Escherichia albertii]